MKKIVIFTLVSLVALVISSCDEETPRQLPKSTRAETEYTSLIELSVDGKTHEFIIYNRSHSANGICHWPDCKYCQTKKD